MPRGGVPDQTGRPIDDQVGSCNEPVEVPGSVAFVHLANARAAFEKALREGAEG
jgi:hypothetical protein